MEVHIMFYCSEKTWSFVTNNYYPNSFIKYTIKQLPNGNWSLACYVNDNGEKVFDESMLSREVKDDPCLIRLLHETVCYGSINYIIETILKIISAMNMKLFSVTQHDPGQLFTRNCNATYYSIQNIWWDDVKNEVCQGRPIVARVENHDGNGAERISKISIDLPNNTDANVYHMALSNILHGKAFSAYIFNYFVIVDLAEATSK